MFLWRSLTPAAVASVAAALTRAKPAATAKAEPATSKDVPASPAEGIAKN